MVMDYASNSNKAKESTPKMPKVVEKVVTSEVVVQKKSLGKKFKDLLVEADFKSVTHYVVYEVLIPAARNTIVDASTKGIERMMYGETAIRRRNFGVGPRITYQSPVSRMQAQDARPLRQPALVPGESRSPRHNLTDFVLSSKEDADHVLERMNDIIDNYEVVSVADLNELVGFPTSHVDNKWGWTYLGDVQIRQIREGYLIDLPSAEPIQ